VKKQENLKCIVLVLPGSRMTSNQRGNITNACVLQSVFLPQKMV